MIFSKNQIYNTYLGTQPLLLQFLTRRLSCAETAADLLHDVYLRLPQLQPSPSSEQEVKAWLFKVAGNLAIDHLRSQQRRNEILVQRYHIHSDDESENLHEPVRQLLTKERVKQALTALRQLPSRRAEVFYLSRVENLSHGQIATRLGISIRLVEKEMALALSHCRRAVECE
ncbi:RNA polymerase sigma factor [Methylocucumis oryzae]|uniref:RNA polymerase subunit sigma-24 n=1 Tax=Methylocucumis oryzae TaxID=1632867 RepID=A0A0F3IMQ4_9GAMM|nr:RNA polymerase sigma factor [Methylocucumis oryzae]KJV07962.1 hypothetical protein VZ94_01265 [Methylocucumis oryzae]